MKTIKTIDRRSFSVAALAFAAAGAGVPSAAHAAGPKGPVVLTVKGKIRKPNAGDRCDFDMAMLEALPQKSFSTTTPWFNGPKRFTGPLLRDVLAAAGATEGRSLRAIALNDYRVEIPLEDARRYDMLTARLLDGQPMPVREKGPLFIIYPFDDKPELKVTEFYSRCAWQLRTLEVS